MPSAPKTASTDGVLPIRTQPQTKESAPSKPAKKTAVEKSPNAAATSTKTARRNREKKKKEAAPVVVAPETPGTVASLTAKPKKKKKKSKKDSSVVRQVADVSAWKMSPFLGGRYSDRDPVWAKDERHLFLAHSNVLKVFSTQTSLLVRSFAAPSNADTVEKIVGYCLDPTSEDRIYVATQSQIFLWSWTTGELVKKWSPLRGQMQIFVSADMTEAGVVFVECSRSLTPAGRGIWRLKLSLEDAEVEKELVFKTDSAIPCVQAVDAGRAVCAITDSALLVANKTPEGAWIAPRVYPMPQKLTCMDVHVSTATARKGKKAAVRSGHVVVGDKIGALYILHDVVLKPQETPSSMKLHWHRSAVSAVKWALDGNYIVSGGLETVLVIWQLETGHKQYLPHLGAAIDNIVVSPNATSYAISLADNSVMTISTSELKATANIAGIQSLASASHRSTQIPKTPCALHPTLANRLLLATPSDQLDPNASAPYLQTFDTYSDRHISRQALARTNATNLNTGPENLPISESNIAHFAISPDGLWLASVDTWTPPPATSSTTLAQNANTTEVFLKFWQWNASNSEWALITRVDNPHPCVDSAGAETILSLISSPTTNTFITTGTDGLTKIWAPKTRHRPGATTQGLTTWTNRKTIPFSKPLPSGRSWWGHTALSADSSVLAVAAPDPGFAPTDDTQIHLISPATGITHHTLGGLYLGRSTAIAILSHLLIAIGTHKLIIYDLVSGVIAHEANISDLADDGCTLVPDSSLLATNPADNTFALAFSQTTPREVVTSKLLVFNAATLDVLCVQNLNAPVTALLHTPSSKAYMLLDAQARVRYLSADALAPWEQSADGAAARTLREVESRIAELYLGVAHAAPNNIEDVDMEDGDVVVRREELARVWDEVPTYAMGPVEEAFDRVYELFAKKTLETREEGNGEMMAIEEAM